MNCIECQERLVDYQEELVDAPTRADFEQHLGQCQACRSEYEAMGLLHERLLAHGRTGADLSIVNRVMTRIRQSRSAEPTGAEGLARFWRWALGLGAATAAVVVAVLFLVSPRGEAMAVEIMGKGVEAARHITSVHIVCRVRTSPHDNFAQIDPRAEFVGVELWKDFGPPMKWRVEKPGRVAVMDGESTVLFLRPVNAALKVPQPTRAPFDTGWLHELADIEGTLTAELQLAQRQGWEMGVTRETDDSGAAKAIVTIQAKSGLPEGDYLKNAFFKTADTRRVYRFDDRTGELEAVQVYLEASTGPALILEVDRIDYSQPIDEAIFQLALPENVRWIEEPTPQADDAKYAALTAGQVAQRFFEACGREDWEEAAKFWPFPLDDRIKGYLGGVKIVQLGEPFTSAASRARFVPYEIELRSGQVKKHNLALKQRGSTGRWFVDGGL